MELVKSIFLTIILGYSFSAISAENAVTQTLIKNVNIFDGKSEKFVMGQESIITNTPDDMLLVDGNPVKDVTVMADWKNNLKVIMKDGKIFKNILSN